MPRCFRFGLEFLRDMAPPRTPGAKTAFRGSNPLVLFPKFFLAIPSHWSHTPCLRGSARGSLYEQNGQAEVVQVMLDKQDLEGQFRSAARVFFSQPGRLETSLQ